MGNFFALDNVPYINNTITSLVYQPPERSKCDIDVLSNEENVEIINISYGEKNISVLQILPPSKRTDRVIIWSHGNATDNFSMYNFLTHLSTTIDACVVCYDYIGYGNSWDKSSQPSEKKCYLCLHVVIHYYEKITNNILLIGQSLGTGITVHCAKKLKWTKPIILISPYKSLPHVVTDVPVSSVLSNNIFDTYNKIDKLSCPVKIYHGIDDEVINIDHAKALHNKIINNLKPSWLHETGHNDILYKIKWSDLNKLF